MQSEAYRLTGFTLVISAFGFLIRWLQNIRIIDAETGLAARGMGISALVVAVIVIAAAALGAIAFALKKYDAPEEAELALTGKTFVFKAVNAVPAALLVVSGVIQLFQADSLHWAATQLGVRRIFAVMTLVGAVGAVLVARSASDREQAPVCRVGSGLLILFGGVWLIATYKAAAVDPVIWRFAVEVLAVCASLMAFYHVAGYFFGEPSPRMTIFFCSLGAFLCIMSAVDEHTLAESLCYGAVAVQLLIWGYAVTANLRREPAEPAAGEE